jgi:hypothetical protein
MSKSSEPVWRAKVGSRIGRQAVWWAAIKEGWAIRIVPPAIQDSHTPVARRLASEWIDAQFPSAAD